MSTGDDRWAAAVNDAMQATQPDEPYWALEDDIEIIAFKEQDEPDPRYRVIEVGGRKRQVVITWGFDGTVARMLFDGVDIDTEAFMGYVGLIDMIEDATKLVGKYIRVRNSELL